MEDWSGAWLEELVAMSSGSRAQAVRVIAALPYDNPLRTLFRKADSIDPLVDITPSTKRACSPPGASRKSSSTRHVQPEASGHGRSDCTSRERYSLDYHTILQSISTTASQHGASAAADHQTLPVSPDTPCSAATAYRCVFCAMQPTGAGAKGSIKRHLKQIHVAPQKWHCLCGAIMESQPKANKHAKECKTAELMPCTEGRIVLKIYACGFTGKCFHNNQSSYLDHLVELCGLEASEVQPYSAARKLTAILRSDQRLQSLSSEVSRQQLGAPGSWLFLRWDALLLEDAIRELELGDLALKPTRNKDIEKMLAFLRNLFRSGSPMCVPATERPSTAVADSDSRTYYAPPVPCTSWPFPNTTGQKDGGDQTLPGTSAEWQIPTDWRAVQNTIAPTYRWEGTEHASMPSEAVSSHLTRAHNETYSMQDDFPIAYDLAPSAMAATGHSSPSNPNTKRPKISRDAAIASFCHTQPVMLSDDIRSARMSWAVTGTAPDDASDMETMTTGTTAGLTASSSTSLSSAMDLPLYDYGEQVTGSSYYAQTDNGFEAPNGLSAQSLRMPASKVPPSNYWAGYGLQHPPREVCQQGLQSVSYDEQTIDATGHHLPGDDSAVERANFHFPWSDSTSGSSTLYTSGPAGFF